MSKISIIIPIYNREGFLETCIDSVLNQSHQNFELILVDDGSTDKSLELINLYQQKDDRILVLNKPNGGVSSARNFGLQHVSGDYVIFIDSDDRIEKDMMSHLLINLEEFDADISICDVVQEINGTLLNSSKTIEKKVYSPEMGVQEMVDQDKFQGYVANKLFKTDLIKSNNLSFNESYHMYEDQLFSLQAFINSNKIIYESIPLYTYIKHDTNISNMLNERRMTGIRAYKNIIEIVSLHYPNLVNIYLNVYAKILISTIAACIPHHKNFISPLQKELKTVDSSVLNGKVVKVSKSMALISPLILNKMIKFKNRGKYEH